jgi:hypothetical protein
VQVGIADGPVLAAVRIDRPGIALADAPELIEVVTTARRGDRNSHEEKP